jgi:hypothetical protein
MNMCLILIGYRDGAVWISTPNAIRFLFEAVQKSEVYKIKVDIRDELFARALDSAAHIWK